MLLSHQSQDNDIALFSPAASQLRPSTGEPLQSLPLDDDGRDINSAGNNPQPQTLQDVGVAAARLSSIQLSSIRLSSISANRGAADESVAALSTDADSGYYTVQIGGYNGASGVDPYVMRLKVSDPPPDPACAARTFPNAGSGVAGTTPASFPSDTNTIFLVNEKRLGDTYGASAATSVMTALNNARRPKRPRRARRRAAGRWAHRPSQSAYAAWDAAPCSTSAANAVVKAINALVDQYRPDMPQLQNIVVVGADQLVPFARIPDLTRISNEGDYAADAQATGSPEFASSFIARNILTDDAYADFNPTPWLDRQIFVPQVAIGRMVETPDQIVAQVNQFIDFSGRLDPDTALTTGYDFLADGANEIAASLDTLVGIPNAQRLINETWTSADLAGSAQRRDAGAGRRVPERALRPVPAAPGRRQHARTMSPTSTPRADIARAPADPLLLEARVIFSMGCHSGLNAPDFLVGSPNADQAQRLLDWPEAFSDQGAAVYVANTGYGYGDTDIVAYSEKVMSLFAERIGSKAGSTLTIGQALAYAKQEYFGSLVQYEAYDEKALQETTFYGLPMFRIGPPIQTPPPVGVVAVVVRRVSIATAAI